MAAGGNINGKHSVIFSRMCVILEDEGKQAELNNEIENLMKRPEFDLYFTSHASNLMHSGGVCGIIWTQNVNTLRERSVGRVEGKSSVTLKKKFFFGFFLTNFKIL